MRPIFKKYPWLLPIAGLVLTNLSPVVMPVTVLWHNREDVAAYYSECMWAMKTFGRNL